MGTSIKHFAANNQENRRMSINACISERAFREIYLASFEYAVKHAKPWTVMCSYNRIDGVYSSENPRLLTDILRGEWGYEGVVISDWGAVHDRVKALKAGLELQMPYDSGVGDRAILAALADGSLDEKVLDQALARLLTLIFRAQQARTGVQANYDYLADHALAREGAAASTVLLQNNGMLPLNKQDKVAVIGLYAEQPRYQGGGSSHINAYRVDSLCDAIAKLSGNAPAYAPGYRILDKDYASRYFTGEKADVYTPDAEDKLLLDEAISLAAAADKVIVVAALPDSYESEGYDRDDLSLPENQLVLIDALLAANANTAVALFHGSPVDLPFADRAGAILSCSLGGEAVCGALADILYGKVNPSARLAETIPLRLCDTPAYLTYPGEHDQADYSEGRFVGYRYYDKREMAVRFPFGHGLSYTSFRYSDVRVERERMRDDETNKVRFTVKNTGSRPGAEVCQLYVCDDQASVIRPPKELKGYCKVYLEPGEEKEVSLPLDFHSFAFWDDTAHAWRTESGAFTLLIGASSADIRLMGSVFVASTYTGAAPYTRMSIVGDILRDEKGREILIPLIEKLAGVSREQMNDKVQIGTIPLSMAMDVPLHHLIDDTAGAFSEADLAALLDKLNAAR